METPAKAVDAYSDLCCETHDLVLLNENLADNIALTFKALADPTRVRLIRYLAESSTGTACACHLPQALGITQPTLSFHMRKLHDAGLVTREKRGRWGHWSIHPEAMRELTSFLSLLNPPR